MWVFYRAAHTDSSKVKSTLAAWRRVMPVDLMRTRASTSDAEMLRLQEVLAQMRHLRGGFGINIFLPSAVPHLTTRKRLARSWCLERQSTLSF